MRSELSFFGDGDICDSQVDTGSELLDNDTKNLNNTEKTGFYGVGEGRLGRWKRAEAADDMDEEDGVVNCKRVVNEEYPDLNNPLTMDNLVATYSKQERCWEAEKMEVQVLGGKGKEYPNSRADTEGGDNTYGAVPHQLTEFWLIHLENLIFL